MKAARLILVCALALTSTTFAQQLKLPKELDRLAAKASEVVNVNMDRNMLAFASKSLSNKKGDLEAKKLISTLNGIYVRSYEFKTPGQYSASDVELIRKQLKHWSKMMDVREKGESVEIYCDLKNGTVNGLVVLAAEPKELTFVHLDGPVDPSQLGMMGGQFGIPKVSVPAGGGKK